MLFMCLLQPLALLIVACVFWHAIKFRQMQYYRKAGTTRPRFGIIFPEMTFAAMDEKIVNFLKCIANYTFYKVGLEVSAADSNSCRSSPTRVLVQ